MTNGSSSPTSSSTDSGSSGGDTVFDQALMDVVRDEFGRVAYSQKTHQKTVDQLNRRLLWEKRISACLVAFTAGNTIQGLVSSSKVANVLALVGSSLALLLTVYGLSRNRERQVEQHRLSAHALWLLREQYVHLIGDLKSHAISAADGRRLRNALTERAAQIYTTAPDTGTPGYKAAQRALQVDEELTFSAHELDVMLPAALRSAPLAKQMLPRSSD